MRCRTCGRTRGGGLHKPSALALMLGGRSASHKGLRLGARPGTESDDEAWDWNLTSGGSSRAASSPPRHQVPPIDLSRALGASRARTKTAAGSTTTSGGSGGSSSSDNSLWDSVFNWGSCKAQEDSNTEMTFDVTSEHAGAIPPKSTSQKYRACHGKFGTGLCDDVEKDDEIQFAPGEEKYSRVPSPGRAQADPGIFSVMKKKPSRWHCG